MKVLVVLSLLAISLALAPLYTPRESVEGAFIVVLTDAAPILTDVMDVQDWLLKEVGIEVNAFRVYNIEHQDSPFRGFSLPNVTDIQVLAIRNHPAVRYVQQDSIVSLPHTTVNANASAPDANPDWGQSRVDQRCLPLNNIFSPCTATNTDCTGKNALAFIVDTGVRTTHQEFTGRAIIGADYASGSAPNGDCNGHGTHCAGSVAGINYGIAVSAQIVSVRVLNCQGSGLTSGIVSGFDYVGRSKKAGYRNILSASLGGGANTALDDSLRAVITSTSGGTVIGVVAAGNDGADACSYSPARVSQAVTVGATDNTDTRTSWSNFGTCVNIFAPGNNIYSAYYTSDSAYATMSGTSMACPITAGTIALLPVGTYPSYTDVFSAINSFATKGNVKSPGTGSPNVFAYDRWNDKTAQTC